MKKAYLFTILVILCSISGSGLEISEVEPNPLGDDKGNEWIEMYSSEQINLEGYYLENGDGQHYNLTGEINGYLIVTLSVQWLDNSDEQVFLKKEDSILFQTAILQDGENNNLTWQKCNDKWSFAESSKGAENECDEETNEEEAEEQTPATQTIEEQLWNNKEEDFSEDEENSEETKWIIEPTIKQTSVSNEEKKESKPRAKIVLGKNEQEIPLSKPQYVSSEQKVRQAIPYAFIGILLLIILLLCLKKL